MLSITFGDIFALNQRQLEPELMDDPGLDPAEHFRALAALGRVHFLTGIAGRLWRTVRRELKSQNLQRARVVDVGCGDGYLLRKLGSMARREGYELELVGCDFSARALDAAKDAAKDVALGEDGLHLDTVELDVLSTTPIPSGDIVMTSLFLHHFAADDVVQILGKMHAAAGKLLVVEDLLRTTLGYGLCWLGVHTLTRSPVVHTDGLLSVRAGFTLQEMRTMMIEAGLDLNANPNALEKHWPERLLVRYPVSQESRGAAHEACA